MASYILAAATRFSLIDELWRPTFDLSMTAANRAFDDLVDECKERSHFVEGHPIGDGYFYGARQLILAGLLSAWNLTRRRQSLPLDDQVEKLIIDRVRQAFIWGESAAPLVLLTALELEQQCLQPAAENFVFDYLRILLMCHDEGMRGLPDSFIEVEDSIRFMHRMGEQDIESYQGFSHTCQVAVDFLARRWRRQAQRGSGKE